MTKYSGAVTPIMYPEKETGLGVLMYILKIFMQFLSPFSLAAIVILVVSTV